MLSNCLKSRKNKQSKNLKFVNTDNERITHLSKCTGLLGALLSKLTGIKAPIVSDLPIANILF